MNFVTEDGESAARAKVGSNNQNPSAFHLSQALGGVMGFVRRRLETILHVPNLSKSLCRNLGYPLQIIFRCVTQLQLGSS
jgi:hypothetical protein